MKRLSFLALMAAVAAASLAQDRSGEARLREALQAAGKMDRIHAFIARYEGPADGSEVNFEATTDLYLDRGTGFRLHYSSYWDEGFVVVSNGQKMMVDQFGQDQPAELSDAPKDLMEASTSVPNLGSLGPMYLIFEGEKAMERFGPENADVVLEELTAQRCLIRCHRSATVYLVNTSDGWRVERIDSPLVSRFSFGDQGQNIVIEKLVVKPLKPKSWLFVPRPTDGAELVESSGQRPGRFGGEGTLNR